MKRSMRSSSVRFACNCVHSLWLIFIERNTKHIIMHTFLIRFHCTIEHSIQFTLDFHCMFRPCLHVKHSVIHSIYWKIRRMCIERCHHMRRLHEWTNSVFQLELQTLRTQPPLTATSHRHANAMQSENHNNHQHHHHYFSLAFGHWYAKTNSISFVTLSQSMRRATACTCVCVDARKEKENKTLTAGPNQFVSNHFQLKLIVKVIFLLFSSAAAHAVIVAAERKEIFRLNDSTLKRETICCGVSLLWIIVVVGAQTWLNLNDFLLIRTPYTVRATFSFENETFNFQMVAKRNFWSWKRKHFDEFIMEMREFI